MDEDEYKQSYQHIIVNKCAFEKSILSKQCQCSLAETHLLAEREGITCTLKSAQLLCIQFLDYLRKNARFVLNLPKIDSQLPHAKELKVQSGGIAGLQKQLALPSSDIDIHEIIKNALHLYKTLDNFPFQEIIPLIAAYQRRTGSRRKNADS